MSLQEILRTPPIRKSATGERGTGRRSAAQLASKRAESFDVKESANVVCCHCECREPRDEKRRRKNKRKKEFFNTAELSKRRTRGMGGAEKQRWRQISR